MRIGSLFSGYGGLNTGVRAVLGGEVAWHVENDPAASKVLAHHWPDVPNLGDITAVDWSGADPVDVMTAGYPCQPFSAAGKRLGEDDDRYLWPEVARAVRDLGPRLVVLENVSGHLVRGFPAVLGSLAEIGYDARWVCVRASDVGAPHRRERLFAVAWPAADPAELSDVGGVAQSGERDVASRDGKGTGLTADTANVGHERGRRARDGRPGPADGRVTAADAPGDGRHEGRTEPARLERGHDAAERGATPADADGDGLAQLGRVEAVGHHPDRRDRARQEVAWGPYAPAIARWEHTLRRAAPAPTELSDAYRAMLRRRLERRDPRPAGRRGSLRPRHVLSPRFVEWLMGLPAGHVTGVPRAEPQRRAAHARQRGRPPAGDRRPGVAARRGGGERRMTRHLHTADAAAHPAGPADPALALLLAQGEAEAMRAATAIDRTQRAGGGERDG